MLSQLKKLILLQIVLLSVASLFSQMPGDSVFVVTGKVITSKYPTVYLLYTGKDGKDIKDSCVIVNDSFSFRGDIKEPTFAVIRNSGFMADEENLNIKSFFLEPGNMTITTTYNDFAAMQVTGSENTLLYQSLREQWRKVDKNSGVVSETFNNINSAFISAHPGSNVSAYLLNFSKRKWPLEKVQSLYNNFEPAVKASWFGKEIDEAIRQRTENSPGKKAKLFTTKDINGKTIQLSQFKKGYVLLDFWASWCGPCRETTPVLIGLYKKYHTQGLNIIGVSVDDNADDWRKAVQKDSVGIWHHVLSALPETTKKETASINALFGVFLYPTKILIDKNGVIIGRFSGTEEDEALRKKIGSLFQ